MTELTEELLLTRPTAEINRLRTRALYAVGVVTALGLIGFLTDDSVRHAEPGHAPIWLQSYLIAYVFWMGITLGSLAILMIQYLSGGAWGLVARRVLEASTRNLPLMLLLFVPIALNLPALYAWARPEAANDAIIREKAAYLNPSFFQLRAVLFFVVWGILIFLLNRWSRQQDENPPLLPGPADAKFRVLSGPGLVLYVLTITFMSVDWIMSLDPHWYSTIFGILTMGGQGLSTMAFTILVLSRLVRFQPMSSVATPENFHDLSKLMFAFVLLWAYFSVSQLLIIWSANLPEEVPFYLERLHGPWAPVAITILIGHFFLPFLILLSADIKRNPRLIWTVAFWILVMRVIDIAWTIGPVFRHEGSSLHWLDFATVIAMGGIWLFAFWWNLAGRPLVPARDPYFKEAMAHGGH